MSDLAKNVAKAFLVAAGMVALERTTRMGPVGGQRQFGGQRRAWVRAQELLQAQSMARKKMRRRAPRMKTAPPPPADHDSDVLIIDMREEGGVWQAR